MTYDLFGTLFVLFMCFSLGFLAGVVVMERNRQRLEKKRNALQP